MSSLSNGSLQPTWFGHVTTARDALILFEACLNGTLHHVPRRPHDRERAQLIKSGCVFIYEENASGIKRWTDGVPWSPSRILGNFLVYRELLKPFPPGEKKRATKRNKRVTKPGEPYPRVDGSSPQSPTTPSVKFESRIDCRESERALIGSLVDSYGFKEGGLVKKTMSVNVHGVHHHLVSYYKIEDALNGNLQPPTKDARLASIEPRPDLVARQNFRAPLDETDDGTTADHLGGPHAAYGYGGAYDPQRPPPPPPPVMLNTTHPHPGQMAMPMYPGMAFSGPPHMQAAGPHSYAPVLPSSQAFYAPSQTASHAVKQEDYAGYGQGYQPDRASAQPLPPSSYGYRQAPMTAGLGGRSGMIDGGAPVAPDQKYSRGTAGAYGPTAAAPQHAPASAYTSSGWGGAPAGHAGLPRPDSGWGHEGQGWPVQSPTALRPTGYSSGAQNNQ